MDMDASTDMVLQALERQQMSIAAIVLHLMSVKKRGSPRSALQQRAIADLTDKFPLILDVSKQHKQLVQHCTQWGFSCVAKRFYSVLTAISGPAFGYQFKASSLGVEKLETFQLKDFVCDIKGHAPDVWQFICDILGGTSVPSSAPDLTRTSSGTATLGEPETEPTEPAVRYAQMRKQVSLPLTHELDAGQKRLSTVEIVSLLSCPAAHTS